MLKEGAAVHTSQRTQESSRQERYTQSLFGHSRIVCAHCLAAPGVISDTGAYYCSATCKEAATTSPLFSDC